MSELPISESFLITIIAAIGTLIAGILACALKSRCSRIKCCCIECDRIVIPPSELNQINMPERN